MPARVAPTRASGTFRDIAISARNHAAHWLARIWMRFEGRIFHRLLHLKLLRRLG